MGIYQGQLCMCDKFQHGRLSGAFAHDQDKDFVGPDLGPRCLQYKQ